MDRIVFIDTEVSLNGKLWDLGAYNGNGSNFHSSDRKAFTEFISGNEFVCGHNIILHDSIYLKNEFTDAGFSDSEIIDTLPLFTLLDPLKPTHSLSKDEKVMEGMLNNPLTDSIKAMELFEKLISKFNKQDEDLKHILYHLLRNTQEFRGFFNWLNFENTLQADIEQLIHKHYQAKICHNKDLKKYIQSHPVELAFTLSLINENNKYLNTPPWVLKNYPVVESLLFHLRSSPCLEGCLYCSWVMDKDLALKKHFGFDSFRSFDGDPLQEKAVQAAIDNKSMLVVLPTGGGKSMTFQLPALISKEATNGLTVVISPLQSLMKDQVDNLEKKGITCSATLNGSLDPIDRRKSVERTLAGETNILYISPESLRSISIEKLLLSRRIERFVVDEAHCFSSWGQDFRVDYLYIGEFIKNLQELKQLSDPIPVSCFTATAKQQVVADIRKYFQDSLNLELEEVIAKSTARPNLKFSILPKEKDEEKYMVLRELIESSNEPTIVYVSRTRKAEMLAERLYMDGYKAKSYHGQMDSNEKKENQDAFISGNLDVIVATSAFGMGVDKNDVRRVVHYDISSSLEDYIQEAGRAGRDQKDSKCVVLYSENDLDKHFVLLNQTKLNINEVKQIWRSVKKFTMKYENNSFSHSALEIARNAGWDVNMRELETRVKTAISALEQSGYLKRKKNSTKIFASSIVPKTALEGIEKIQSSPKLKEEDKEKARRILVKLISKRSRSKIEGEEAESRVDYIADQLGMHKREVIDLVNFMKEENILNDYEDLTAYIKLSEQKKIEKLLSKYHNLTTLILDFITDEATTINIKEINEEAALKNVKQVTPQDIITILNYWAVVGLIRKKQKGYSKDYLLIEAKPSVNAIRENARQLNRIGRFAVEELYRLAAEKQADTDKVLIEFSSKKLVDRFNNSPDMFEEEVSIADVEDTLLYLTRIGALKIEGGFLVLYQKYSIERLVMDNSIQYKKEDFKKLSEHYRNKAEQIHIVGEYAKRMLEDNQSAMTFVEDYFQENYDSFINRYFPGSRKKEIRKPISPRKFKQLFGELSERQLSIINDKDSKVIVVAAGPGSGKTRLLVHKLASLIYMEEVKFEQLLMLTFSRAAVSEFKTRLISLIGNGANFIDIKTFHSYCFDLLGERGKEEKFKEVVSEALERIRASKVEPSKISKTVMVIDEAQDMKKEEFELVNELIKANDGMRLIAVGDDDQNIYEFRGSSSEHFVSLLERDGAKMYELLTNYRSKSNLIQFTNTFLKKLNHRLKSAEIVAQNDETGSIYFFKSKSKNLAVPLVQRVKEVGIRGTMCVLTRTNKQAEQVVSMLIESGYRAKLLTDNNNFKVYDIRLIRKFLSILKQKHTERIIDEEVWQKVKFDFQQRYRNSNKLDLLNRITKTFEKTFPKSKYITDLEVFIKESKEEDFYDPDLENIYVTTNHKSKGKEFDTVYLLVEDYSIREEEAKRVLYVAMTRAKNNLAIFTNTNIFDDTNAEGIQLEHRDTEFPEPRQNCQRLTHWDVYLSYSIKKQKEISELLSGEPLILSDDGVLLDQQQRKVAKLSSSFMKEYRSLLDEGSKVRKVEVENILWWYNKDHDREYLIVLPEVWWEKS